MKLLICFFLLVALAIFSNTLVPKAENRGASIYCPFDRADDLAGSTISRSTMVYEAEKFACECFKSEKDTVMCAHSYYSYQQKPNDFSFVFWLKKGKGVVTVFDRLHPKGESKPADWFPLIATYNGYNPQDSMFWPKETVFNSRHLFINFRRGGFQSLMDVCPEKPEWGIPVTTLATMRKIDQFCQTLK